MPSNSLERFTRTLSGHYSNKAQASNYPTKFAHVNIYFRPIPWNFFQAPGFYSEQSYDHSPWSPYKQSIHRILVDSKIIIVENYKIINADRIAGSGFMPDLLNELSSKKIQLKNGCSMHFTEIRNNHFIGLIEAGKKCLINREKNTTYLISKVTLNNHRLTSLDQGFDIKNNELVWGSENGEFLFDRIQKF